MSADPSKMRQQIARAFDGLDRLLTTLLRSAPMAPGSLYLLRRKCGKPSCRCARGSLHASWVLTRSEAGQQRLYSVPAAQRAQLRSWTAEYRRYQRARAQWVKRTASLLSQMDALAEQRVLGWPAAKNQPPKS